MSSITVVYDSIEKSIPVVEALGDDCATLSGKVGEVSGELESIGADHDSCFANSISAVEVLSTFVTKMGAEYDAIASFAKTATSTFKEAEGQIIADTAKIEDMKTMLSYLGMSEASVSALNFDKINGYKTMDDYKKADDDNKADISLYEEYYKDTNADLGEVEESAILDMMVTSDGKGSYRTVTTEEMKKYIEERAKAQATAEAESTVTGPAASVGTAAAVSSGVSSGISSGVSSSSTSSSSSKEDEKAKEKEDKDKTKDEEEKTEEEKTTDELDNKIKELEEKEKELQEKLEKAKSEEAGKQATTEETKSEENKTETKTEAKEETKTVVKNVKANKPKASKAATSNAQSIGNVNNNNSKATEQNTTESTNETPTEPIEEVPVEETPIEETVPEEILPEETPQEETNRTTVPLPTEENKKSGSSSSVIPAIAGIATAAAAGIGTKIYLDKKANSDDDYEGEDEEYYDEYEENSNEELSEGSSIQSPDSTWDSSQDESNLKY